ncbi:MAG TPA: hypothetical protein DDZ88_14660 [Verrucomicrobiales bacterium]|nr:hypothetical protein [Verrucomicrobiales bacterium]
MHKISLLVTLLLIGCASKHPLPPPLLGNTQLEEAEKARADYAKEHTEFRCEKTAIPTKFVVFPFDQGKSTTLMVSPSLRLRLKLGKFIDIPGTYTRRSESNYILSSASGNELGLAESMMCKVDDGIGFGEIRVVLNPLENSVIIEEATGGAGACTRHIVFVPKPGSNVRNGGRKEDWQTFHVSLPIRSVGPGYEGDSIGRVFGLSGRKIYLEMDGVFYAFPLEKVVTTELGVSTG